MQQTETTSHLQSKGLSVEAILAGMPTDCKVAVQISNYSNKTLHYPIYYMGSGDMEYGIPSEVCPNEKRACGFRKLRIGFFGCGGILIYHIKGSDKRLCLSFSNPNSPLFKKELAILVENNDQMIPLAQCFQMMSSRGHSDDSSFCKSTGRTLQVSVTCSSTNLKFDAKMLDASQSIISLNVTDHSQFVNK